MSRVSLSKFDHTGHFSILYSESRMQRSLYVINLWNRAKCSADNHYFFRNKKNNQAEIGYKHSVRQIECEMMFEKCNSQSNLNQDG